MTLKNIVSAVAGALAGMVLMRSKEQLRPAASAAPAAVGGCPTPHPEDCPRCK
ncbi:hypothetical protein [Streptomyces sp. NPDC057623]|uniref:hypothetical protein n=1 Tax=Streptomyces sp. NPDC057623 TaxID=3346187 RepID=UPI0036B37949